MGDIVEIQTSGTLGTCEFIFSVFDILFIMIYSYFLSYFLFTNDGI